MARISKDIPVVEAWQELKDRDWLEDVIQQAAVDTIKSPRDNEGAYFFKIASILSKSGFRDTRVPDVRKGSRELVDQFGDDDEIPGGEVEGAAGRLSSKEPRTGGFEDAMLEYLDAKKATPEGCEPRTLPDHCRHGHEGSMFFYVKDGRAFLDCKKCKSIMQKKIKAKRRVA